MQARDVDSRLPASLRVMNGFSFPVAIVYNVSYACMLGNADASRHILHVERTVVVDKLTEIVVVPESLEDGLGRTHVVGSDRFSQVLRSLLAMVPRH